MKNGLECPVVEIVDPYTKELMESVTNVGGLKSFGIDPVFKNIEDSDASDDTCLCDVDLIQTAIQNGFEHSIVGRTYTFIEDVSIKKNSSCENCTKECTDDCANILAYFNVSDDYCDGECDTCDLCDDCIEDDELYQEDDEDEISDYDESDGCECFYSTEYIDSDKDESVCETYYGMQDDECEYFAEENSQEVECEWIAIRWPDNSGAWFVANKNTGKTVCLFNEEDGETDNTENYAKLVASAPQMLQILKNYKNGIKIDDSVETLLTYLEE